MYCRSPELPDDVLVRLCGYCQALDTRGAWTTSLVKVCKQWAAVLSQPSVLWRKVEIDLPAPLDVLSWLQPRLPAVQELVVRVEHSDLHARGPSSHVLSALLVIVGLDHRCQLRKLHLDFGDKIKHLVTLAAVSWVVRSLEDLQIDNLYIPRQDSCFNVLSHMSCLRRLSLRRANTCGALLTRPLSAKQAACLWSALSSLQHLESLELQMRCRDIKDSPIDVPEALCTLRRLRHLELRDNGFRNMSTAFSALRLQSLSLAEPFETYSTISALTTLTSLSVKFKPPGDLNIHTCTNLHVLKLEPADMTSFGSIQVHPETLQAILPMLESVTLIGLGLRHFPEAIINLTNLSILNLECNGLDDLPSGPYLTSLRMLNLSGNFFLDIPTTLKGATGLEELDIGYTDNLEFTKESVNTIESLKNLQRLRIAREDQDWDGNSVANMIYLMQGDAKFAFDINGHNINVKSLYA